MRGRLTGHIGLKAEVKPNGVAKAAVGFKTDAGKIKDMFRTAGYTPYD